MSSLSDINKHPKFKTFYEKNFVSHTYFFLVFKCDEATCKFHKPLRGPDKIDTFPDPEPYEVDGVIRYRRGSDPEQKFLRSKLEDPEKRPHNKPFSPTAQTAKNVAITIPCEECKKPRLLHSQN